MKPAAEVRPVLSLMRPAQWPILTVQLAVGFVLALPESSLADFQVWTGTAGLRLGGAWLSWVVLLNGGTLAFNSAYDRDTGPVAYLARPPEPPPGLAGTALVLMGLGVLTGWVLVGWFFGLVVAVCLVLSVLYSHPRTRWKTRPGLDLLTNMVGYGTGTTLAGLSTATGLPPDGDMWWFAAGFGLLFGSLYPLTQIYQIADDRQRGDRTLSTALGTRAALGLALGLGLLAGLMLGIGCRQAGRHSMIGILGVAMGLWSVHLIWWWLRAGSWTAVRHERGMYAALGLWALIDMALAVVWLAG